MPTCAGCGQLFMVSGLGSHLKQTQNPQCEAIFKVQYGYIPDSSPAPLSDDNVVDDQVDHGSYSDHEPMNLDSNDANYDPANDDEATDSDPGVPPASGVDESDYDESDLDDIFEDFDIGWEPAPEMQDDNIESEDDYTTAGGHPPPSFQRSAVHDALQKPGYVEHFNDNYPHAQAGALIGAEEDMNTKYKDSLGDERIWTPFTSRMDWEVARWAKLRGPSSTAVSELLAIEGVSTLNFYSTRN
jgi:hypothetical protein